MAAIIRFKLFRADMVRFISIITICFLTSSVLTAQAGTFNGLIGVSVGYDDNTSLSSEEEGSSFMSYTTKLGFRFFSDKYPTWETEIFTDGIYREYFGLENNENDYRLRIGGYSTWAIAGGRLMPGIFGHAGMYRDELNPSDEKDGIMIGAKLDWLASARMTLRFQHTRHWMSYKNPYIYSVSPTEIVPNRNARRIRSHRVIADAGKKPLHSNFSQTGITIPMPQMAADAEKRFMRYGYYNFSLVDEEFVTQLFSKSYVTDDEDMFIVEYTDFSFDENRIYLYSDFSITDEYTPYSGSYAFSFGEKEFSKTMQDTFSRTEKTVQQPSYVYTGDAGVTSLGSEPPCDCEITVPSSDSDKGGTEPPPPSAGSDPTAGNTDSVNNVPTPEYSAMQTEEKLDESISTFGIRGMFYFSSYLQSEISAEYIRSDFSVYYESYIGKSASFSMIWTPDNDWEFSPTVYWKRFDYENMADGIGRHTTEQGVGLNISRFFKSLEVFVRMDFSDHHSDFDIENYRRTITQCGIVWSF